MDKYLLWHQLSLVQQLNCVCDTTAKGVVQTAITRSVLQEQDEATRARRYRFLKQNEREKLTYYLELKKIQ